MISAVIDASVAVKWFASESDSSAARRLLDVVEPFAPDWLLLEVAHVAERARRNGVLSAEQCRGVVEMLEAAVTLVSARQHVAAAQELAAERGLSVYDAIYLALALDYRLPLITADMELAAAGGVHLADFVRRL
ncbi:MAG: type II toxin-antitoxin system VapC family toxin [Proteobacteria bacterium]|nr:type II toxin-antitoxin system VapC family toxin [Pseudomonadota bacterium]MBI3498049.1 type II toxin-antitoxin system VapC family toxin [Pseudomonadota bacterium]